MRIDDLFNQAEVAARVALENTPRTAIDAGSVDATQSAFGAIPGRIPNAGGQLITNVGTRVAEPRLTPVTTAPPIAAPPARILPVPAPVAVARPITAPVATGGPSTAPTPLVSVTDLPPSSVAVPEVAPSLSSALAASLATPAAGSAGRIRASAHTISG